MRKTIAVVLSLTLTLLAPGMGGWAYAAQIIAPKTAPVSGAPGGLAVYGAGGVSNGALQNQSVVNGQIGAVMLPGVTPVNVEVSQSAQSALALPVSPALLNSFQSSPQAVSGAGTYAPGVRAGNADGTPGVESAQSVLSHGPSGSGTAALPAEGGRRTRGLLKALSLPSLFKKGGGQNLEEDKTIGAQDFRLHTRGAVSGSQTGTAAGRRDLEDFATPPAAHFSPRYIRPQAAVLPRTTDAPTREGAQSRWSAFAKFFSRDGGPGFTSGTLSLQNPDGPLQALKIRPVNGSVDASAARAAKAARPGLNDIRKKAKQAQIDMLAPGEVPAPQGKAAGKKPRAAEHREYRSALLPLLVAGLATAGMAVSIGAMMLLYHFVPGLAPVGVMEAFTTTGGISALGWMVKAFLGAVGTATLLSVLYAGWESLVFAVGVGMREPVADKEFYEFIRKELKNWKLHPSVRTSLLGHAPGRGMLKPYRPPSRFSGLAYGYTAGGSIYLRPEMIRTPTLFRWVLKHELIHLEKFYSRGPPKRATGLRKIGQLLLSEIGARWGEWRSVDDIRALRIPVLDRVLFGAHLSLQRSKPYDVLMIHPGHHEVRNPAKYRELSRGQASIVELYTKNEKNQSVLHVDNDDRSPNIDLKVKPLSSGERTPSGAKVQEYLGRFGNQGRFRMIVYPQSYGTLPEEATTESKRLSRALAKLDQIYMLSKQLPLLERSGAMQSLKIGEVERLTNSLGIAWRAGMSVDTLVKSLDDLYFRISRQSLSETGFVKTLESVYAGLHHRGAVLLPFAPGEPGFDVAQRVIRYWRAEDGGAFMTSRVDLAEGGHVIVARKAEPRVDLWLRPAEGKEFEASYTNVNTRESGAPKQEEILRRAGFSDGDIERFRNADMEVRHVFGGDVGDNRIYVNVRRSHAQLLKRYAVEAGISFQSSERFDLHLVESGPMQNADKTWELGFDGSGGRIYDIDTGLDVTHPDFADRELTTVDFVDEGPEDWIGHGTHKAGISYANGTIYKGMAPKALGRMGKVFAQNGTGASDGEIMAAAVDAMQWGADVISLSLGSPGTVDAPLAEFFSKLTQKENANGEFPIVTGSAGNSGPFNNTKSQPSVGKYVASIAAAAKSLDDGVPEISFYSSVGPAYDRRWGVRRYRRPLGLTALGGDVTTPPGVKDVYADGIESVKSKDMAVGPSDAKDGRHVRMSGTSMSNPMIAGIALLVKQAVQSVIRSGTEAYDFFYEELPFAVNMILMRSAEDMRVPIFFQEGGFVDALAAVQAGAKAFGGDIVGAPRRMLKTLGRTLAFWRTRAVDERDETGTVPWDWIRRAKEIWNLEDVAYIEADKARKAEIARVKGDLTDGPGGPADAPFEEARQYLVDKREVGDAGNKIFQKVFAQKRAEILPKLTAALGDRVWIVRMYAAFALLNLKAPEAAIDLLDSAVKDADGRVRQTAFLAIAETPNYSVDEALRSTLADARADVSMYAAYALARHGKTEGLARVIEFAKHSDKKIRFSAVWLLGQLGRRAPPEITDALAGRVIDTEERANIRHLAVASLTEVASAHPESLTDETILNLLYSSGPDNFALTRTISKFFTAATNSASVRKRMAEKPLRDDITKFIHKNKAAIHKGGALGEMVRLLARILNVPLDIPTPLPNPNGVGVVGIDPNLGPVHLIVEIPEETEGLRRVEKFEDFRERGGRGEKARIAAVGADETSATLGLEPQMLKNHSAELQTAMPASQSMWFNVPDANVVAFSAEMESRGYRVRRAAPMYRLTHETGELSGMPQLRKTSGLTGEGVLVVYLDEGGDTQHPAISKDRIAAKRNFTDDGKPDEVERESVSHGTHGMGIVGARSIDGSPYVGMAPGVNFAVGKVLGATGGSEATVMAGMEWAASLVEDPLKTPVIVNMSLGGPGSPEGPISRLLNQLRLKNVGVVAAAGNSGPMLGTVSSPANAALAIAVGAVDKEKKLTDYSSRSPKGVRELSWLDFGGAVFFDRPNLYEIVSALNTRLKGEMAGAPTAVKWKGEVLYHTMSGTSMAAPHTTGKLSVLIERMKKAYPQGLPPGYLFFIEKLVERTAIPMENVGENESGAGLIDETAALAALEDALKDPKKVAFESETMFLQAKEAYGRPVAPPAPVPGNWFRRLGGIPARVAGSISAMMTLFLLP